MTISGKRYLGVGLLSVGMGSPVSCHVDVLTKPGTLSALLFGNVHSWMSLLIDMGDYQSVSRLLLSQKKRVR